MPIPTYHQHNFATLQRAGKAGHLALMECRRRSDGAAVSLLCAVSRRKGEYTFTPIAEMIAYDESPYDLYDPPAPDGGFIEEASNA